MALTAQQIEEQKKQAEELFFSEEQKLGFAKGLFFGHFNGALLSPYPELSPKERPEVETALAELRRFLKEDVDSVAIDRDADIPRKVVDGLARIG
ncbi:MAG TPA: acyl-CoA dehydrogenase, partial [Gemmataceae bacterium]|nr:acyl-CoA dehydrogenase [Gemmataceae bacterium]